MRGVEEGRLGLGSYRPTDSRRRSHSAARQSNGRWVGEERGHKHQGCEFVAASHSWVRRERSSVMTASSRLIATARPPGSYAAGSSKAATSSFCWPSKAAI